MKVFIINMAKDVRRKKDMQNQFDKLDLDVEFFEGANGKLIPPDEFSKIAAIEKLEDKEKRPISELKGMVGCTYSHYLIYQKMINENIEVACVLEDDIILASDFGDYLSYIEKQIRKNEIISLHTLLYNPILLNSDRRKYKECEIMTPEPPKIRGTQGYVITNYCATQLAEEMMPIKEFPDCFNRYHLFCEDVQIRVLFPFIIRHMWVDSVRDEKSSTFKNLINMIQTYRVFPLWNWIRSRRRSINDKFIHQFIIIDKQPARHIYLRELTKIRFFSKL
ncbi:MAG: glycosyltransferase family 25 protein [Reichenbachiella sp.]|uniref:glycosyltransferase family 25 protein n=1 Tax=Reichenbachiella sp. TaxID=2184521 RepID=UPI00329A72BC